MPRLIAEGTEDRCVPGDRRQFGQKSVPVGEAQLPSDYVEALAMRKDDVSVGHYVAKRFRHCLASCCVVIELIFRGRRTTSIGACVADRFAGRWDQIQMAKNLSIGRFLRRQHGREWRTIYALATREKGFR